VLRLEGQVLGLESRVEGSWAACVALALCALPLFFTLSHYYLRYHLRLYLRYSTIIYAFICAIDYVIIYAVMCAIPLLFTLFRHN